MTRDVRAPMLLAIGAIAAVQALACGTERWPVKTATDKDKVAVADAPVPATIAQLRAITAPEDPTVKSDRRYGPTERTVYETTGRLTLIKQETDQDYHIVIADAQGHTMIIEAVDPSCATGSRFETEIKKVRSDIDAKLSGPIKKRQPLQIMATVTGVGFFDRIHGQEGVAPNGIELHPLLEITFHDAKSHAELRKKVRVREERD